MSIPRRLLRIAADKLRTGIDGFVGEEDGWIPSYSRKRSIAGDARQELEDFLRDPNRAAAPPPARETPHPLVRDFATLGLKPTAGLEEVQKAWRRCARDNHPDRYSGDPPAQKAAQERFLIAQAAYERIVEDIQAR
jgi:DnaJ-domain-containing protein 1